MPGAAGRVTLPAMEQIDVDIRTPNIRLDGLLKFASLVGTGGEAKFLIQNGRVRVNGRTETRRGHRIEPGDEVLILDETGAAAAGIRVSAATP